MTIQELQSIHRRLGNQCWCRWWANFGERRENILMAIQCLSVEANGRFKPTHTVGMIELGFTVDPGTPLRYIYTIPRTNEDGSPYVSELF
jgi:hypothetical protein